MDFFLGLGASVAAVIALWQGIAAHGGMLNVPWARFLRSPKMVGGVQALLLNGIWLLSWVVVVTSASTLVALFTSLLRPAVQAAATSFGVEVANTPGASLFLMSIGTSLYFTLGTAHTCQRLAASPPESLILNSTGPNPAMGPRLAFLYWRAQGYTALIAFFLTSVLVPFYRYFLDRRGILENGCVRLLLQEFGNQQIIEYCESVCRLNESDNELNGLFIQPAQSDYLRAYACCMVLIRRHGYGGAHSRIVQERARPHRNSERFVVGSEGSIEISGLPRGCTIVDASSDGSGLCVSLVIREEPGDYGPRWHHVRVGYRVTIILDKKRFELNVTRSQSDGDTMILGLRTPEVPEVRRTLLDALRPRVCTDGRSPDCAR